LVSKEEGRRGGQLIVMEAFRRLKIVVQGKTDEVSSEKELEELENDEGILLYPIMRWKVVRGVRITLLQVL